MYFKTVEHSLHFNPSASLSIPLHDCLLFLSIGAAKSTILRGLPALFCLFPSVPPPQILRAALCLPALGLL